MMEQLAEAGREGREVKREKTIVVSASEAQLITPDQVTKSNWQREKGKLGKENRVENEKKSSLKR